ncbi:Asp23/Gls24 family envelope stress response protein [Alkalicoccobacillus plakortidis]|uniref:Alkaline shock protein 23 n=1 Tax=Alkalicoccobacillus plakortidis TaxID=444060 RepID=A0ABT0XID2_9BACI|nr:Asp23/Gls24 family envelope stress response protein [Alkalicoccobacillus plakortidis]MCM2675639.1 Asp23/Gls24 family envelope stress response protein [Alkalicoccobacillus plakortidis]
MEKNIQSTEKTTAQLEKEQHDQTSQNENRERLTYDNEVIKKITALATNEVSGILGMSGSLFQGVRETFGGDEKITKGISADVGEKQVAIDIEVYVEYGKNIPSIYKEVKESVSKNIHNMTGLELVEFNMNVDDVYTREEFESKRTNSSSPNSGRVE